MWLLQRPKKDDDTGLRATPSLITGKVTKEIGVRVVTGN